MKKINIKNVEIIIAIFAFMILFMSYWENFFNIVDMEWFTTWQEDSEWLVWQRITDKAHWGFFHNAGLLGEYSAIKSYDIYHDAYTAQVGLQGSFFLLLSYIFPNISMQMFYAITVLGCISCLFFILWWLRKEFDFIFASAAYVMLLFNQWLTISAKNLYWVLPTFLFPLIISMAFFMYEDRKGKLNWKWLLLCCYLAIFIRCACGYEFISSVMITLELPVFYYAYKNQWTIKQFFVRFLSIGGTAIAAFLSTIFICVIQNSAYMKCSWSKAFNEIFRRIVYRTGAFSSPIQFRGIVRDSLYASKWEVILKYFFEGEPIFLGLRMNTIIIFILIGIALCFTSRKFSPRIHHCRKNLFAFNLMLLISFFAPISWLVLASGHAYIHTHICYFLWSIPCVILGGGLFIAVSLYFIIDMCQRVKPQIVVSVFVVLLSITGFLFVNDRNKKIQYVDDVKKEGQLLGRSETTSIYYLDGELYYYSDRGSENNRYYLHYYPKGKAPNELGYYNKDFKFNDFEIETPVFDDEKVARIELPSDYSISLIETGQYNIDDGHRYWQVNIDLPMVLNLPQNIAVVNLSDDNWLHGFNKKINCFLVLADNVSLRYLTGEKISVNGALTTEIVNVEKEGDYFWVYTKDFIAVDTDKTVVQIINHE